MYNKIIIKLTILLIVKKQRGRERLKKRKYIFLAIQRNKIKFQVCA